MNTVTITLSEDEAIVLHTALERLDESTQRALFDEPEWMAVWRVKGQIESQNRFVFDLRYIEILNAARRRLVEGK